MLWALAWACAGALTARGRRVMGTWLLAAARALPPSLFPPMISFQSELRYTRFHKSVLDLCVCVFRVQTHSSTVPWLFRRKVDCVRPLPVAPCLKKTRAEFQRKVSPVGRAFKKNVRARFLEAGASCTPWSKTHTHTHTHTRRPRRSVHAVSARGARCGEGRLAVLRLFARPRRPTSRHLETL